MILKNETFDKLKWIAQIGLPAFATFWFSISAIWNIPYAEQIVGTLTAVDTMLGICLGISSKRYNDEHPK